MNAKDRIYKDADFSSALQFSERVAYDVHGKMRNPDAISNEVFDSIKREVVEEVNIPASSIISVGLIGIVTNVNRHGKPDAVFIVRTNLTAKEVCISPLCSPIFVVLCVARQPKLFVFDSRYTCALLIE